MNSRDHRREAEKLLESARAAVREADPGNPKTWAMTLDRAAFGVAAAGVHARLAALPDDGPRFRGDSLSWDEMEDLDHAQLDRSIEDILPAGDVL